MFCSGLLSSGLCGWADVMIWPTAATHRLKDVLDHLDRTGTDLGVEEGSCSRSSWDTWAVPGAGTWRDGTTFTPATPGRAGSPSAPGPPGGRAGSPSPA